ncbi:MAG: nucleotide exchange factor GrpE [Gloeomargarita sp. DG_2_bins_126]
MVTSGSHSEDLLPDPFAETDVAAEALPAPVDPPSGQEAQTPTEPEVTPPEAPEMEPPVTFGDLTIQFEEEATPEAMAALREELLQERERYRVLKTEHEALEQKVAQLEQQVEEQRGQMVRLAADFDNYRRRVQREQEEASLKAKAKVLEELLAVVDNFERARTHIRPETEEGMSIHKNYQGVYKQMVEELKKLGVAPIPGKGQPFDPNRHEAVLQEASSEYPEGIVTEELRRGYFLKVGDEDRVLRHALVKVSTGAATESATD